jgi:hypothetical protein
MIIDKQHRFHSAAPFRTASAWPSLNLPPKASVSFPHQPGRLPAQVIDHEAEL